MVVYALLSWNDPHVVIHVRRSGELVKRLECRGPSNHLQKIPVKKKKTEATRQEVLPQRMVLFPYCTSSRGTDKRHT
jgi:hypothetical protein